MSNAFLRYCEPLCYDTEQLTLLYVDVKFWKYHILHNKIDLYKCLKILRRYNNIQINFFIRAQIIFYRIFRGVEKDPIAYEADLFLIISFFWIQKEHIMRLQVSLFDKILFLVIVKITCLFSIYCVLKLS